MAYSRSRSRSRKPAPRGRSRSRAPPKKRGASRTASCRPRTRPRLAPKTRTGSRTSLFQKGKSKVPGMAGAGTFSTFTLKRPMTAWLRGLAKNGAQSSFSAANGTRAISNVGMQGPTSLMEYNLNTCKIILIRLFPIHHMLEMQGIGKLVRLCFRVFKVLFT